MTVTTRYYLVTIIAGEQTAEHLISNVRQLKFVNYVVHNLTGGKPGDPGENGIVKVEILCARGSLSESMNYLTENYVKRYGAVCYYIEVNVPV